MKTAKPFDPKESTTYWFLTLQHAEQVRNFEQAAEATRELRRLGIDVRFRPRPENREAVPC